MLDGRGDIGVRAAGGHPIAALRRMARPRRVVERCDLCAAELGAEHAHLFEPATRELQCACDACAILFNGRTKFRRVPRDVEKWGDFVMADGQWEALGVPIALAFFFRSSVTGHVTTMYPSPAGATEGSLPEELWGLLCADNPRLSSLEADVEALLVNRIRGARGYYRAPIDQCFKLVGLLRTHWRGMSGGKEMWARLERFFGELEARCGGVRDA
jgi:hypothetical protein